MISRDVFSSANILVMDDEISNVILLETILKHAGYTRVRTTTDSRQVMALYEEDPPDILLLDWMMPHIDGAGILDLLGVLVSPTDFLPILVLTADVSTDTRHTALRAGASDFLTKPFDHVEVLLRVHHLLCLRDQQQQLARQADALQEQAGERDAELRERLRAVDDAVNRLDDTRQRFSERESMEDLAGVAAGLACDFNRSLALILEAAVMRQGQPFQADYQREVTSQLDQVAAIAREASGSFDQLRRRGHAPTIAPAGWS